MDNILTQSAGAELIEATVGPSRNGKAIWPASKPI
jgi:hypothetical protein